MRTKIFCSLLFSGALSVISTSAQEIATWANWKKAAVTFTFDDAANEYSSHRWAADQLQNYKFPATFYVVTNWTNNSWSNYQTLVNQGHEVGSHTDSHTSSDSELASSRNTINQHITGQKCLTIAYPNCIVPTESQVLANYIGGRICGGQINSKSPSNYARLDCIICGSEGNVNSAGAFTQRIQSASNTNGWVVFLIHGISDYAGYGSYSPTSQDAFKGALSFLDSNKDSYWVCTFRDAIMYAKERDNSKLSSVSSDDKSATYSLTKGSAISGSSLCDYDYPLSVRVPVKSGWTSVSVVQGGKTLDSEIKDGYVYFNAIPGAGDIVVSSASASTNSDPASNGGSASANNSSSVFEFANPSSVQEWCKDSSYTIKWTMDGEASGTYSLVWNACSKSKSIPVSSVSASSEWSTDDGTFTWYADNILTDDGSHGGSSRWGTVTGKDEYCIFNFGSKQTVGGVLIDEFTEYGSVSSFEIQYDNNGTWETAYVGTTIGEDFITSFAPVSTTKMRFFIKESGDGANINFVSFLEANGSELKKDIAGAGSFEWTPDAIGDGTLTITDQSGAVLATSAAISVANCGGSQAGSGDGLFFDENGAYYGPDCDQTNYTGAYYTGNYTSPFKTYLGKTDEEIQKKLDQLWNHYFKGNENSKVYYDQGNEAYIFDTGNSDVRSEGMSYGMMICVQTNHKEEFDKIWNWAKNHMWHKGDDWDGYFAWKRGTNGFDGDDNCAPDGEMYFMMSLLFAANRWNDSKYMDDAQYILKRMWDNSQHKLFNPSYNIITFQPQGNENNFSDPSYDLPAFVDLFSRWSTTNQNRWAAAAKATRDHLYNSSNKSSGLFSDYNNFDGTPHAVNYNEHATQYMYDAMRCAMNFGMDYYLFGADATRQEEMARRIIDFFEKDGYRHGRFNWDGSNGFESYTLGETGANAVACYALMNNDMYTDIITKNLKKAWDASLATGNYRYYDGLVHYLSMLHLCGSFKIWKPAPTIEEKTITSSEPVEIGGVTYSKSSHVVAFEDCKLYNVKLEIKDPTSVPTYNNFVTSIGIAPNPAKESFEIICKSNIAFVKVYSIDGRVVMEDYSGNKSFSTENLNNGTYIVCVASLDGSRIERIRLNVAR